MPADGQTSTFHNEFYSTVLWYEIYVGFWSSSWMFCVGILLKRWILPPIISPPSNVSNNSWSPKTINMKTTICLALVASASAFAPEVRYHRPVLIILLGDRFPSRRRNGVEPMIYSLKPSFCEKSDEEADETTGISQKSQAYILFDPTFSIV